MPDPPGHPGHDNNGQFDPEAGNVRTSISLSSCDTSTGNQAWARGLAESYTGSVLPHP